MKKENNKNLVYLLYYDTWDENFIGQTKILLETRKTEHADNIKKDPSVHNVISKHITENSSHDMDWENIKILHHENHQKLEALNKMTELKNFPQAKWSNSSWYLNSKFQISLIYLLLGIYEAVESILYIIVYSLLGCIEPPYSPGGFLILIVKPRRLLNC